MMKVLQLLSLIAVGLVANVSRADTHSYWFDKPAQHFTESLPLGNGRLGAMIFGGIEEETIVLNESGMWSGSSQEADRPDAYQSLPEIRRLLFAGKNKAAEELMNESFICAGAGSGLGGSANLPYGCYQTLGELKLKFRHSKLHGPATNYRRKLDLRNAKATITYSQNGVDYSRTAYVSYPDQAIVLEFTSNIDGKLDFDISLNRSERSSTEVVGPNEMLMTGQLNDGHDGDNGVKFAARLKILPEGGAISQQGNVLKVRDANRATVLLTARTDLQNLTLKPVKNPKAYSKKELDAVSNKPLSEVWSRHKRDYKQFYDRVNFSLLSDEKNNIPIDQKLAYFAEDWDDVSLVPLYFNFGRYLLICSSRPDGLPANLQGIWAHKIQTPWNCDWHLNINVQMNYWPAEVCNLSEFHEPLFRLIETLVKPGAKTAKKYYNANGWVAHVLANPWGYTSPGESASWGSTSTCSAWLCQHIWEHFLYTQDQEFLKRAYPLLKGSAEFYLDTLVKDPDSGWLVTAPSNSPENSFYTEAGEQARICVGSTMDMQLLRYLFSACQKAAILLDRDEEFCYQLEEAIEQLAPTRVGSDGRILEWDREYKEVDPFHRHLSHLWGLFPGNEIELETTPELAEAAHKTLDMRGDDGTGWSLSTKMAMWARLKNGERAYKLLRRNLMPITMNDKDKRWHGGTYPNLFNGHPPYQIDGNFGATAAIAELLLQSSLPSPEQEGEAILELLPALPPEWGNGEISGLRARGGFEVDLQWEKNLLRKASITSLNGLPLEIRYKSINKKIDLKSGQSIVLDGMLN